MNEQLFATKHIVKKTPSKNKIRNWKEEEVTKWFLDTLAKKLNRIDTVRNISSDKENLTAHLLGRTMAIEIIEDTLREVIAEGELAELQEAKAQEEEGNVIKMLEE